MAQCEHTLDLFVLVERVLLHLVVGCRIKQCTEITTSWVFVSHHEMGHIEYFLQYAPEPTVFRDGANPGTDPSGVCSH